MASDAQSHPALRLVNDPGAPAATALPEANARAVRDENEDASRITSTDARWAIAAATATAIEGGTAAIIRPERRQRLIKLATRLGLRPFDANLIIAIVQDAARCGQAPLGPDVADRLRLIREPGAERDRHADRAATASLLTAVALGAMLLMSMILWILR